MLNSVRSTLSSELSDTSSFADYYTSYVMKVQDEDIENEILPLIKHESTEYVGFVRKMERSRKRARRKMQLDF